MRFLLLLWVFVVLSNAIQAKSAEKISVDPITHYVKATKKHLEDQLPDSKDQFTAISTLKLRNSRPEETDAGFLPTYLSRKENYQTDGMLLINNWWENCALQHLLNIHLLLYPKHHFW